jgi:hypothetical protein
MPSGKYDKACCFMTDNLKEVMRKEEGKNIFIWMECQKCYNVMLTSSKGKERA